MKKASSFYSSDAAKYKIGTVEATGAKLYVDFTQDLLSQLTTQEVTFEAEGYKTLKVKFTYTE